MKILILYNARSGHKHLNFAAYLNALAARGAHVETRTISKSFNLQELLTDAKNFDRVVVAGGDGTVSTAAGILQNTGIPILAYPGGTANLLTRNLSLPSNAEQLADITLGKKTVQTDLGELEYMRYSSRDYLRQRFLKRPSKQIPLKVYFSIMAGCGFAARLISQAEPMKSTWGQAAYWLSAFWNLFPRRATFLLKLDGKEIRAKGIGILIVNFKKIQFNLKVISGGGAGDGKFEIIIVKARSLFGLIPMIWGAVCEKFGFDRPAIPEIVEEYCGTEIEISSSPPLKLQFDGEILKKTTAFKIRVCPGAAQFICA